MLVYKNVTGQATNPLSIWYSLPADSAISPQNPRAARRWAKWPPAPNLAPKEGNQKSPTWSNMIHVCKSLQMSERFFSRHWFSRCRRQCRGSRPTANTKSSQLFRWIQRKGFWTPSANGFRKLAGIWRLPFCILSTRAHFGQRVPVFPNAMDVCNCDMAILQVHQRIASCTNHF